MARGQARLRLRYMRTNHQLHAWGRRVTVTDKKIQQMLAREGPSRKIYTVSHFALGRLGWCFLHLSEWVLILAPEAHMGKTHTSLKYQQGPFIRHLGE